MRTRVRAVALPPAAVGLRLAGIAVDEFASVRDAADAIQRIADQRDVGLLLVEQPLLDAIRDPERQALLNRPAPIVVPFPSPVVGPARSPADLVIRDILQRAVGYRVRLR